MRMNILDIMRAVDAVGSKISPSLKDLALEICTDSRKVDSASFFVCFRGDIHDAHQFIPQVLEKSCPLILVDEKYLSTNPFPVFDFIAVPDTTLAYGDLAKAYASQINAIRIGITGSNGKTTTKEMLKAVLETKFKGIATKANNNNHIGVPLTLFDLEADSQFAIVEIGTNHDGEIAYGTKIAAPHISVINNIGDSHLEFFQTRERVFHEKLNIRNSVLEGGTLFLNGDDPFLSKVQAVAKEDIVFFGIEKGDIRPSQVSWNRQACAQFVIDGVQIQLQIPGKHNLYNALAVYGIARKMDVEITQIKSALESFQGLMGRTEMVEFEGKRLMVDCYNANPTSMEIALRTLSQMQCAGRRIAVLGDMFELGAQGSELHQKVGEIFHELKVDILWTCGELAMYLGHAAQESQTSLQWQHFEDLTNLTKCLSSSTLAQDLILFKASNGMKFQSMIRTWMGK